MMALFQLATPFIMYACIQCMRMNKWIRLVLGVPQGAAPTWAISRGSVMECVVMSAVVGGGCVATAVFTKAVWNMTIVV